MNKYPFLKAVFSCAILAFSEFVSAADVTLEEVGLVLTLPTSWTSKYEQTKLPSGQLMQRWVRDSVQVGKYNASPGLIVVASPVPKNANLALLTQSILSKEPHSVKLGAETQCIKCVRYQLKRNGGVIRSIAPNVPPSCSEYKPGIEADCIYQSENGLNLSLEPSWVNRFEKDATYGKSYVLVVHALVDEKLVDLTFVYPKESAAEIEPEIASIVSSIKRSSR